MWFCVCVCVRRCQPSQLIFFATRRCPLSFPHPSSLSLSLASFFSPLYLHCLLPPASPFHLSLCSVSPPRVFLLYLPILPACMSLPSSLRTSFFDIIVSVFVVFSPSLCFFVISPSPCRRPQRVYFSGFTFCLSGLCGWIIEHADPWLHSCCLGVVCLFSVPFLFLEYSGVFCPSGIFLMLFICDKR